MRDAVMEGTAGTNGRSQGWSTQLAARASAHASESRCPCRFRSSPRRCVRMAHRTRFLKTKNRAGFGWWRGAVA